VYCIPGDCATCEHCSGELALWYRLFHGKLTFLVSVEQILHYRRISSSGMLRRVAFISTDVSEGPIATTIRVKRLES
jgi:hypothetical protein